ncbi:MAG: hypothetical protein C0467_03770 [Planctomycetaceae bacterium]|nr:hypothetical protein [Planctomycetaceae bacterium]
MRRGATVTLTGYAEKTDPAGAILTAATLHCRDVGTAAEQRFPMIANGNAAFHFTRPATTDFEYRVEAGGTASDWFTVATIDAVELADGSVTEVLPPRYAPNGSRSLRPSVAAIDGFQHGTAEFRLRFTRAPADAHLEFRAEGAAPELIRLALSADRLAGTATLRLKQDGTLRLVTVTEQDGRKLRVEEPAVAVRVLPDAPPRFEQVSGISPSPMTARPGDRLSFVIAASDDVAIGSASVEYALGTATTSVSVSIPLVGVGTSRASGRLEFDLPDKIKLGETIRFRIRVFDSRRLDEGGLKPQEVVYPEAGWTTIKLDADSPPTTVQEIVGRRDLAQAALEQSLKELREEALPAVERVIEDADKPTLPAEHFARLGNSRENVKKAVGLLSNAGRETALCPELRPVAAGLQVLADSQLKDAEDTLRRASLASPPERAVILASGRKQLTDAADRLEELVAQNTQLARARLDTLALTSLANEQTSLATLAATKPPAELIPQQQELLARLSKLLQDSAPLRKATDAARQQEFDRLAGNATELAEMIRDLNIAAREFHDTIKERIFAAITADQKGLATDAVALLSRVETAARLANAALPKAEEFRRVSDLIADGKNVDALVGMAQLAISLDSVATTFDRFANDRLDSKVGARHLALWQDDLRTRFRMTTGGNTVNFATLPAGTKAAFRNEQSAIRAATQELRVSPGESTKARDTALEQVNIVGNFLNGTGAGADRAMEIAVEHLNDLAKKLPTVPERLAKTRPEFDKIVREQESIVVGAEQVFRNSEPATAAKKLTPFTARQQQQIVAFAALDLPGFDARRTRALASLAAAATDLESALVYDVPASQAWVKREFERLRNILFDNTPPPDDKADELTRRLEDAAKGLQATGATPAIATNVQDVYRQLGKMTRAPEAAALLYDSLEAVRTADLAFRTNPKPAELLRKVQVAAEEVGRLSDRLNGGESDHDRIRRLAANRRVAVARAKEIVPNSPVNPEATRELARELEEFSLTRVGFVAQVHKKRLMDEYARLRDKPAPDRQAGAHANLATSLEELAALMADIGDLTATFDRTPVTITSGDADTYLPSRPLAAALRDLAGRHRVARERITNLPGEMQKWTKPAKSDPLALVEKSQRELAADVSKLVEILSAHSVRLPADPYFAESESILAADHLRNGSIREASENGDRSARLLRKLAESPLARGAANLADRQERNLQELTKVSALPGVIAARQRARVEELARLASELAHTLETTARDTGAETEAGKTLTESAATASAAGKLLSEADSKWAAGKPEEAAALRDEAEAQFRVVAARTSGAGPAPTTLPTLDPDTAAIGESLRRSELAMRQITRELTGTPDAASVAKTMRISAEGLHKAAKTIRERLATEKK